MRTLTVVCILATIGCEAEPACDEKNAIACPSTAGALAIDGRVYWLDSWGGLHAVDKTGGRVQKLTTGDRRRACRGVIISDGEAVIFGACGEVWRVDATGAATQLFTAYSIIALTVDADFVYVASDDGIDRIRRDGSELQTVHRGPVGVLVTDGTWLYFGSSGLWRMSRDGGTPERLSENFIDALVIADGSLYSLVGRRATHDGHPYIEGRDVRRRDLSSGEEEVLVPNVGRASAFAVRDGLAAWIDPGW